MTMIMILILMMMILTVILLIVTLSLLIILLTILIILIQRLLIIVLPALRRAAKFALFSAVLGAVLKSLEREAGYTTLILIYTY